MLLVSGLRLRGWAVDRYAPGASLRLMPNVRDAKLSKSSVQCAMLICRLFFVQGIGKGI